LPHQSFSQHRGNVTGENATPDAANILVGLGFKERRFAVGQWLVQFQPTCLKGSIEPYHWPAGGPISSVSKGHQRRPIGFGISYFYSGFYSGRLPEQ